MEVPVEVPVEKVTHLSLRIFLALFVTPPPPSLHATLIPTSSYTFPSMEACIKTELVDL